MAVEASRISTLVVADEKLTGEVRDRLLQELDPNGGAVRVVAPALADSGFKHVMGDVDSAVEGARERLEGSLAELREAGIDAHGEVGDADPMVAISDEVTKYDPQRVVVVAREGSGARFAEKGLAEQLERDLDRPVTELMVEPSGDGAEVADVEQVTDGRNPREARSSGGNLPPLNRRDVLGIVVAAVGTIILGVIASKLIADIGGHTPTHNRNNATRNPNAPGMAAPHLSPQI